MMQFYVLTINVSNLTVFVVEVWQIMTVHTLQITSCVQSENSTEK